MCNFSASCFLYVPVVTVWFRLTMFHCIRVFILEFTSLQAGSVQVRVRRDAEEQMVLAHVYNRLSNLVSRLTVQIVKDDWTRGSSYNLLAGSSFPSPFPPTPGTLKGPSPILDQSQRKMSRPFSPDNLSQEQRTSTPIRWSPAYGTSHPELSHQGHGHSHQGHGHSHQGHGHSHWESSTVYLVI